MGNKTMPCRACEKYYTVGYDGTRTEVVRFSELQFFDVSKIVLSLTEWSDGE